MTQFSTRLPPDGAVNRWLLIFLPIAVLLIAAAGWFVWETNERRKADARIQRIESIVGLLNLEECEVPGAWARPDAAWGVPDKEKYLADQARSAPDLRFDCLYPTSLVDNEKYVISIAVSDRSGLIEALGREELAWETQCNDSESMESSGNRVFLRSHDGVMGIYIFLLGFTESGALNFLYVYEEEEHGYLPLTDQEQNSLKQTAAEIQRILNEEADHKFETPCPV